MEYREVVCRNCGHGMRIPEGASRIRCEYCDTEYFLSGADAKRREVRDIDFQGQGPLLRAYIPDGWNYRLMEDNNSVSSLAARCFALEMMQEQGEARMTFLPTAYYKNPEKSGMFGSFKGWGGLPGLGNLGGLLSGDQNGDYRLNPMTMVRYRRLVELPQYAQERIVGMTGSGRIELTPVLTDELKDIASRFAQEASQKLEKQVNVLPGVYRFTLLLNGGVYDGYFATIMAVAVEPQGGRNDMMDIVKKGMAAMGAMYGIGGMGTFDWGRAFDLLLMCGQGRAPQYEKMLYRFIKELQYLPLYYELQERELRSVQQIQLNGAMQRQQNAIQASQRISRTLSETSDIVNQGYWDRSAAMDRMQQKASEAVRGVNSYMDSAGNTYEADVKYDHVYRNGSYFAGSTNGSASLGPEWEELKRHY